MTRRRNISVNIFLSTMFYWPVFLVSRFLWLAYRKELTRTSTRFCLRYLWHVIVFDVVHYRRSSSGDFCAGECQNLKSHDKGRTFRIIMQTLDELGYDVADAEDNGPDDPKIIDGKHFLPQHRERIVLVGFRRDPTACRFYAARYRRSTRQRGRIWRSCWSRWSRQNLSLRRCCGNIFIVMPASIRRGVTALVMEWFTRQSPKRGPGRFLLAIIKDGAEILVDRGWDMATGEKDFDDPLNQQRRPRRLTPRECARLVGFRSPGEAKFRIPVSDTQAYRQFGNSVVVPVFAAVAKLLEPKIKQAVARRQQEDNDGRRSR